MNMRMDNKLDIFNDQLLILLYCRWSTNKFYCL